MTHFIIRRLLMSVLTLFGVSVIVFMLLHLSPGDPVLLLLPEDAPREYVERLRHELGFDSPLYVQYGVFVIKALQGDMGTSLFYKKPAMGIVLEFLPATIQLTMAALLISLVVAFPMGILSAIKRDSVWDYTGMFLATIGQATPVYWLGIMMILVFSVKLHVLPSSGRGGLENLIMPAIALGAPLMAIVTRMIRSGMLDILGEDYVRTARAKGLPEWVVLYRHAMRNMLIPVVTVVGLQLGSLLGGAVITETVFAWPGVGRAVVTAIGARDYPLVQAATLLVSLYFVVINLLLDILYAWLDPRIRFS
jgi:peptide/nickel transport system permease protein